MCLNSKDPESARKLSAPRRVVAPHRGSAPHPANQRSHEDADVRRIEKLGPCGTIGALLRLMSQSAVGLRSVNNDIYSQLGARWYEAADDPVALLRAEARLRNPWLGERIAQSFVGAACNVLDIGCGGGFLTNYLAQLGHRVTGLDEAADSLEIAARHDHSHAVKYERGDALNLPYADASFDVVCAMDFLEHVEDPERAVSEAARVLKPSGLFFFHTFNRNWLSWLIVIKGVEWFVKNTPPDMHVLHLFLKPEEVAGMCERQNLKTEEVRGSRPKLGRAFFEMLLTREVPADFSFTFTASTRLGYTGYARKA